ncbi:putative prepilin-type N-terminal cleavage/methylation domain protein [Magnetofaba australis IT-1]|uniref:Putative prepilin-type N-terminal cleavage/methylation domain protein n=2 Tax=Magnetofaba TaxID=1472292 RepID=A0A1Y2K156_9PROT|nr:putative prepilin-type N-terminal cleavage/methylation domain protein [Magnetofaba australis IT-1]
MAGFTLMESIVVIAILGILAATISTKYLATDDTGGQGPSRLTRDIRKTQARSMTFGGLCHIKQLTTDSYQMQCDSGSNADAVTLTGYSISSFDLRYNSIGEPTLTGANPITVTKDDSGVVTEISINMVTGYPMESTP